MNFKTLIKTIISLTVAFSASTSFAAIANNASVYFSADEGSWVGGAVEAKTVTWTHGIDGVFFDFSNKGSFRHEVYISYDDGNSWSFEFAAPTYDPKTNTVSGQFLHTGLYTGAQRFPFNSPTKPGMDISGNGRGNNRLSGWFNILEISYDDAGNLNKFAVDFKQFDEQSTTAGLYGSLRFNSAIPVNPVPEPETVALMLVGCTGLFLSSRRRKKTSLQVTEAK